MLKMEVKKAIGNLYYIYINLGDDYIYSFNKVNNETVIIARDGNNTIYFDEANKAEEFLKKFIEKNLRFKNFIVK